MTSQAFLAAVASKPGLLTFNRGIEREALRVNPAGGLASTPHPRALGSKLTHPRVTTDFSEAQLELITPVHQSAASALAELDETFRYIYQVIDQEVLWSASMPCVLQDDAAIPLAYYGTSNLGRLKTTYRSGLGYRYGRGMQTICAVHYNFSVSDDFWSWLREFEQSGESEKDFRTRRYFDLMRNFRRYSWLLTYLFGASPAVCNSFIRGKQHDLEAFDEGTAYLPHATSLRSGNLGYQSDTQAERMRICYNGVDSYVSTLAEAICTPHQAYREIGVKKGGEYRQVNTNILQSEAEFYSSIRAKCVPPPGANFLATLLEEGVQYVEVRLLDVNPFLPLGIDEHEIRFLDTFLLYCLVTDSPAHDQTLCDEVGRNSLATVYNGRSRELILTDGGRSWSLHDWATEILDSVEAFAGLLDSAENTRTYAASLQQQRDRISNPDETPSGQILEAMRSGQVPFFRFAMDRALAHENHFRERPLPAARIAEFEAMSRQSEADQAAIEAADTGSFDDYLDRVARGYLPLLP